MDLKELEVGRTYEGRFWVTQDNGVLEIHVAEKKKRSIPNSLETVSSDDENFTIQANNKKVVVTLSMPSQARFTDWSTVTSRLINKIAQLKLLKVSL